MHKHDGTYHASCIELALCYKIGFGTDRDEAALENVIKESRIPEAVLEKAFTEVVQCSEGPQFRNLIYRDMVEEGKDFRADFDTVYQMEGHLEDALKEYTKEMENLRAVLGPTHILTLVATTALCYAMHTAGNWDAALELRISITKMLIEVKGEYSRDALSSKSRLAAMYIDLDQWDEAEKLLLEVRGAQLKLTSNGDHETIETAHALAEVYRRKGKWKEAEALLLPALEERQRSLGPTHPDTLRLVSKVAALHLSLHQFAEAQVLLEELVEAAKHVWAVYILKHWPACQISQLSTTTKKASWKRQRSYICTSTP